MLRIDVETNPKTVETELPQCMLYPFEDKDK